MSHNSKTDIFINTATLQQLKENMSAIPNGFVRILDIYLDEAPQLWCKLEQAVAEGDNTNVRLYAHSLKSQCASMGAEQLAEHFYAMEAQARDGVEGVFQASLEEARPLFIRVNRMLAQEREKESSDQ